MNVISLDWYQWLNRDFVGCCDFYLFYIQKSILFTSNVAMSQNHFLEDISASKVKLSLAHLLHCENVNYCIPIMGHYDPREQQEWVAMSNTFVKVPVSYQCWWTEIRVYLISLCLYLHKQKESQREIDGTPWWAPLQQKLGLQLNRGIVRLREPLPTV